MTDTAALIDIIVKKADADTRAKMLDSMLAACKSFVEPLRDDAAKWAHCGLVPGGQKQPRACIHEHGSRYYLPDGTLFAEVEFLGRGGMIFDDNRHYKRTVYLSDGILTEWWECCTYTCIDMACSFNRSEKNPYPTTKRRAEDENERPVAPPLRAE